PAMPDCRTLTWISCSTVSGPSASTLTSAPHSLASAFACEWTRGDTLVHSPGASEAAAGTDQTPWPAGEHAHAGSTGSGGDQTSGPPSCATATSSPVSVASPTFTTVIGTDAATPPGSTVTGSAKIATEPTTDVSVTRVV